MHPGPGQENLSTYKTRVGIRMFILYTLLYAGFMAVNTLCPVLMDITLVGLNLALLSGFGLIVFAFVLACLYNHLCTTAEKRLHG